MVDVTTTQNASPQQPDAAAAKRPGRPRSEQADLAIVDATLELISEVGIAGLSIEQVAAEAGVGKATIYRRWPTKEALVVDAMATLSEPLPPLPGRSVREDLILVGRAMMSNDSRSQQVFPCVFAEGHRHPGLVARYTERVIEPRREVVRQVLRRGVATGELRPDLDIELALLTFSAPLLMVRKSSVPVPGSWSDELPERVVDALFEGFRRR